MSEIEVDEQGRPRPPREGDEASTLVGFLEHHRATFAWRCSGLDDDQLRTALPPTAMTLGGMLKHLAYVEDYWFTQVVAGLPAPAPWADADWDADPDWEWHSAAADSGDELRTLWAERVERSRDVVTGLLGVVGDDGGGDNGSGSGAGGGARRTAALAVVHPGVGGRPGVSLRWVLVHLVEEYARHNGHADLLRESLDGRTGV